MLTCASYMTCSIVRHEGIAGLLKGAGPTVAKAAPSSAVSFAMYEYLVALLAESAG